MFLFPNSLLFVLQSEILIERSHFRYTVVFSTVTSTVKTYVESSYGKFKDVETYNKICRKRLLNRHTLASKAGGWWLRM